MSENYVKVLFRHDAFENESVESAWVRHENDVYTLDNILFYAKEYAWGDVITVEEEDGELYASGLVKESGHSTVRMLFPDLEIRDKARGELKRLGCSSEISNFDKLISVDIPPHVSYDQLVSFLESGEERGDWEYEEACISSVHR